MKEAIVASRWIEGLYADLPGVLAARRAFKARLSALEQTLQLAADPPDNNTEYVHQLRVSSRRLDASIRVFRPYLAPKKYDRARNQIRRVRRAASLARNDDVLAELLGKESPNVPAETKTALKAAMERIAADRKRAQAVIVAAGNRFKDAGVRETLLGGIELPKRPGRSHPGGIQKPGAQPPYVFSGLADVQLPPLIVLLTKQAQSDLDDGAALHRLRIAGKKIRYAIEILIGCLTRDAAHSVYRELVKLQSRLGRINDYFELAMRLEAITGDLLANTERGKGKEESVLVSAGEMALLADFFRGKYERNVRRFRKWFDSARRNQLVESMAALLPVHPPAGLSEAALANSTRRSRSTKPGGNPPIVSGVRHRRVAAIDVGTNSIRMAIAETDPAIGFRIIEDVKETTRLGTGVFRSGKLRVGAVKRSLAALQHMRKIAEGYKVDSLRAVATSAVREAANGADFVKLVRRRVGVPIDVIQPQREARLAFSGVSRDFDLADNRIAVVDTGGGSTELIYASSGVIDAIRPIPLGAVRLTEAYGDPAEPGHYRFGEMRKRVDKVLKKSIRRTPYRPDFIVGAGGTFTTLARIALREGAGPGAAGRFPFAVRGCELRHKTVLKVLNNLRRMSLEERCRVPGVSSKRAEILVAGLAIVERLMEFLGVDRLLIHDGGIRDGLVAEMIDDLGFRSQHPRTHPEQVLGAVARFAERVRFPREHSEHVARLALRIFDALAEIQPDSAGVWARPAFRDLLHSAALLHDVGRRISRKSHHKHSYDMIVHADLATLTRREIEIIANICRYHRKAGPRRGDHGFRKLGSDDQRLVAHLAGILRVADGLDYSQKQIVTDVFVRTADDVTVFEVASTGDARTELRRAASKADVFESAFRTRTEFSVRTAVSTEVSVS